MLQFALREHDHITSFRLAGVKIRKILGILCQELQNITKHIILDEYVKKEKSPSHLEADCARHHSKRLHMQVSESKIWSD